MTKDNPAPQGEDAARADLNGNSRFARALARLRGEDGAISVEFVALAIAMIGLVAAFSTHIMAAITTMVGRINFG